MARINILEKGAQFINAIIERLNGAKTKPEWDEIAQDARKNQAFKIDPFLTKLHSIEKTNGGLAPEMQRSRAPQQRPAQQGYQPQAAYAGGYQPAPPQPQQTQYQVPQAPKQKDVEKSLKDLLDSVRQRPAY